MKKISEAISGVNHDIEEYLVKEYFTTLQEINRLKKTDTSSMACGDDDHHLDLIEGAANRLAAIELIHAGYKNMQAPGKEKYNIIITSRSGVGVVKYFDKNNLETLVIMQKFLSDQWIINYYCKGE